MKRIDVVVSPSGKPLYDRFHFASAVRAGELLLCSGQIGIDASGRCPDDPETQFTRAFELLGEVLAEAGVGFGDVVEITTFHVGLLQHMRAFASVKDRFLAEPWPAWTAIGVSELAFPGALVEVRATARLPRATTKRPAKKKAARRAPARKASRRRR
jgi:enamine deaminase RidA (YjgF/YER057c/UK114 family)